MAIQANIDNYNPFNDILENGAKGGGMMTAAGSALGWTAAGLVKIIANSSAENLKNKGLIKLLREEQEKVAKQEANGTLPPIIGSESVPNTKPTTNPSLPVGLGQLQNPTFGGSTVVNPGTQVGPGSWAPPATNVAGNTTTLPGTIIGTDSKVEEGQVNTAEKPTTNDQNGLQGEMINPVEPETNTGEEGEYKVNGIDLNEWKNWYEETRQAAWDREDQIRKETQEREDTAYQRSVADMLAAGINPNLMNVQPASSGGGITNATQGDATQLQTALTHTGDLIEQMIAQAFEGDQNAKDRFNNLLTSLIGGLTSMILFKV